MKRLLPLIILLASLFFAGAEANAIVEQRTKNVATYFVFPIFKNDGTLITSAAGLDTECDFYANGTAPNGFADATNEATEIGATGYYYLLLSQAEMNNDLIVCKTYSSSTGAVSATLNVTTLAAPANIVSADASSIEAGDFAADGTAQAGAASTIQLASAETYADDQVNGNCVSVLAGTGKGQQRLITDYVGSTDTATVTPNWTVTPSTDSTYAIGGCARVPGITGTLVGNITGDITGNMTGNITGALSGSVGSVVGSVGGNVTGSVGSVTGAVGSVTGAVGSVTGSVGSVATDGITAASIATDAIGAAEIAANAIGASEVADSAIDAGAIASNAIAAAKIASDAITSAKIANDAIGATEIANSAIDAATFAAGAIDAAAIATNAVDADALAADAVDEVWDEAQSGHTGAGTFGKYLDAQVSAVSGGTITWTDLLDQTYAGHTTAGTVGGKLNAIQPPSK